MPSAPKDNESRENDPRDMFVEEGYSSQASPPAELPQRGRRVGERMDIPRRREEGAASSRRKNDSHTRNASQQQGAI
ncbi:UNVERIFIED_CONTAM: hypothetical protein Sangu_1571900 [Sesamum angustifolium]|uniref:Uncharacterized protein n=1 Tax=Sesamum angustifolium TaxID=2727405 RepID=A0AAW2MR97_9LAMI